MRLLVNPEVWKFLEKRGEDMSQFQRVEAVDEFCKLLSEARDFVGKSRCSIGHSVSEVKDRAKPGMRHCLYCAAQLDLYQRLSNACL